MILAGMLPFCVEVEAGISLFMQVSAISAACILFPDLPVGVSQNSIHSLSRASALGGCSWWHAGRSVGDAVEYHPGWTRTTMPTARCDWPSEGQLEAGGPNGGTQ